MSRAVFRTLVPASAGIAAVLAWLFWLADPCLGTNVFNRWSARDAPQFAATASSDASGALVVVENPYGVATCHYWPGPANHVIGISVLLLVMFGIGWVTALSVRRRPRLMAATIAILSVAIAFAIQIFLRVGDVSLLGAQAGFFMGFVLAAGACIAMLAASLARRWQSRVTSSSP